MIVINRLCVQAIVYVHQNVINVNHAFVFFL